LTALPRASHWRAGLQNLCYVITFDASDFVVGAAVNGDGIHVFVFREWGSVVLCYNLLFIFISKSSLVIQPLKSN